MEKKRIAYIDVVKCLAIFIVIDLHILKLCGIGHYDVLSSQMLYAPVLPLFFFVSGFLSYKHSMTIKECWNNIRRKFLFLVIPAVVFRIAMDVMSHKSPLAFIAGGMRGYWFTVVLFECFLIYYLVTLAVKNEKWRIGVLLLLSLAGVAMLALNKGFGPAFFDLRRVTKFFQFFVLGTLAMKYRSRYESLMSNEIIKAALLVLYFMTLFLLTYDTSPIIHHLLRDVALRYVSTFAVISFFVCHAESFQRSTKMNSLLNLIGQNTLPIYFLHYFFLPHFDTMPEWLNRLDIVTMNLVAMLYAVAITALCLLFSKFLSNSKYVRKFALGKK